MDDYFAGIDIGTQGARVVLIDANGEITWSGEESFAFSDASREEQSPLMWWEVCSSLLRQMTFSVSASLDLKKIRSLAVTSTSGTMIPLDQDNNALHDALMYSDKRSVQQALRATSMAMAHHTRGFTNFNYSSGLAKIIWFSETYPEKTAEISKWIHAADYVTGKLCGNWGVTDYTNAFKSGYDVSAYQWPEYIYTKLPILQRWLPDVVPSGTIIGQITDKSSKVTGLPTSVKISAGITDGCASQVASGAINPGDWNTTIGTTMVIKGVTMKEIIDPQGRVYSHRHPEGFWMPGGASNTGADWVSIQFGNDLDELNRAAGDIIPGNYMAYPLMQQGERFPMVSANARGFGPDQASEAERFTANMEGVAYLERYAYDLISKLSSEKVKSVFTAGGGSNSEVWLLIRASVLNKPIFKMKNVSGAVGAAIIGASKSRFRSLHEAARKLVIVEKEIQPDPALAKAYEERYRKFLREMKSRGYIE